MRKKKGPGPGVECKEGNLFNKKQRTWECEQEKQIVEIEIICSVQARLFFFLKFQRNFSPGRSVVF